MVQTSTSQDYTTNACTTQNGGADNLDAALGTLICSSFAAQLVACPLRQLRSAGTHMPELTRYTGKVQCVRADQTLQMLGHVE